MAGTSRTNLEGFYGELSGVIASQWGEDIMASVDDKVHMSEQTSVQTVQGPLNFSKSGSVFTFASPLNLTGTGINTFAGPLNATSTGINTFAGPMNFSSTNSHTFGGPVNFNSTLITPNSNNLHSLITAEITQLGNIGTTTISSGQWGYLGTLNQALHSTASPTFSSATFTSTVNHQGQVNYANGTTYKVDGSGNADFKNLTCNGTPVLAGEYIPIPFAGSDATYVGVLQGGWSMGTGSPQKEWYGAMVVPRTGTAEIWVMCGPSSQTYSYDVNLKVELGSSFPHVPTSWDHDDDYDLSMDSPSRIWFKQLKTGLSVTKGGYLGCLFANIDTQSGYTLYFSGLWVKITPS